jgi:hypothetical protein
MILLISTLYFYADFQQYIHDPGLVLMKMNLYFYNVMNINTT